MADDSKKASEKYREASKEKLTSEQYNVCWNAATERAFSGKYWDCKDEGTYHCVACDNPLFSSETKFDSGTGWPSFFQPVANDSVALKEDRSHYMTRTEVLCGRCRAHLGHVFSDGPAPTGERFCMNSASLNLKKK